jgi:hypothetical protein
VPDNWLNADAVVHGSAKTLLTSQVPLGSLNRYMAKEELNLVQFTASFTTQACACAAKFMGREFVDTDLLSVVLNDVPHDSFSYACSLGFSRATNTPKHTACIYTRGLTPGVNGGFDPVWNWHRPNVSAFTDQIHNGPVILAPLEMVDFKFGCLSPPPPAA